MHIELSEILACPRCGSPQGLVVMVDELDDEGRLREGDLGCSRCERRFPVAGGVLDLLAGDPDPPVGSGPEPPVADRPPPEELAVEVAALLDLPEAPGPVVLGRGLASAAGRLAEMAGDVPVLALAGEGEGGDPAGGDAGHAVARAPAGAPPVLPGKAGGVALWRPSRRAAEGARAALAPGARLLLLRPGPGVRRDLEGSGLEVVASEERAAVARRPG